MFTAFKNEPCYRAPLQKYINSNNKLETYEFINLSVNICVPNEHVSSDGGKEKLPVTTRGRNLERNHRQKRTYHLLGDNR